MTDKLYAKPLTRQTCIHINDGFGQLIHAAHDNQQ